MVYPAPTLVVGVGRLGLATLERLGDDWMGLELSGADESIRNLRLIAVREAPGEERGPAAPSPPALDRAAPDGPSDDAWRRRERPAAQVARFLGEGDLPTRALDLAILRSLGLVRYHEGTYQVSLARDDGAVEEVSEGTEGPAAHRSSHRRRYFEWLALSPDPIVAAERLRQSTEHSKELDLFLTPLLNRMRQGHSPRTLLAAIGRCFALLEGRDPSPWGWLRPWLLAAAADAGAGGPDLRLDVAGAPLGLDPAARRAEKRLEDLPEPLPGWMDWLARRKGARAPTLALPATFLPGAADPASPMPPRDLLGRDWQATSWAIDDPEGRAAATFLPLPVTPLRLGLFDHDSREADPEVRRRFAGRLVELGRLVHQGLLRLWVDLQRTRIAEADAHLMREGRARDYQADALQQSLEILGELVVRPMAADEAGESPEGVARPARPAAPTEQVLPAAPSRFLSGIVVDEGSTADPVRRLLAERLAELGLDRPGELASFRRPLLSDVVLEPADLEPRREADDEAPGGLRELRRVLNSQVRSLFDFGFLTRYRRHPTRRPPRLTVFVVGDMSEPFVRAALRAVLRDVHAELLRAFTPIFRTYREGFDRSLCVTPILWMPHPADPFEGAAPEPTRSEESAIIDAVHGIRHWVECVLPAGKRFIPQIFVNSRVTDVATLSLADAVRQTRDFLSFQVRNDLAGDPWLRATAAGSGQADLFSSFSCYEIDFPALRCREYLANRMARELLGVIQEPPPGAARGPRESSDEDPLEGFAPPALDGLVETLRAELGGVTGRAGREVAATVRDALPIDRATRAAEIEEAYDERFERNLRRGILDHWRRLTGKLGKIDDLVDDLRRHTSELLSRRIRELTRHSDELITDALVEGGLGRAMGRLHRLRSRCRDLFQAEEAQRETREELAGRHAIPELGPLAVARAELLTAARDKPDLEPLRLGLVVVALLAPVLGAPLAQSLAYFERLHLSGGLAEALLGPLGPVTGGLALFLPAWALLSWHVRRRTRALAAARERLAAAAERILRGSGGPLASEPPTSIRSFLEARLELTGAVATRGFALHVLERVLADTRLAERLSRSIDIQHQILSRRAEDLGVRATMERGSEADEDLERLLDGHGTHHTERLIGADSLRSYYRQVIRQPTDLVAELPDFVPAAGGIDRWRTEACLTATERILGHCRRIFRGIVDEAVWDQHFFREDMARRLVAFVGRCYSNLGFGAEFRGYEGLDPDGVPVLADAALVLHRELARVFEEAREDSRALVPTTRTLEVVRTAIRPNAAYMLSLVQGIRVHSVRNLRRFESFHDRLRMPDDRAFPLTQETREDRPSRPLNSLSGFEDLARERSRSLLAAGPDAGAATPGEGDD